ncbi:MAG: DsbA family protein [Bryobacteraceae bacterium]|nr:DsbA family protein [Bryobacteraceae bacterium]
MKLLPLVLASAGSMGLFAAEPLAKTKSKPLTSAQGDEILTELKVIRQMLESIKSREVAVPGKEATNAPGKPATALIVIDPARVLGDVKAPLTLVEFTDYQCGFCSMFHRQTFPSIKREFIDKGLVRFVSMDLPLDMHSEAFLAAKASRCALEQGKYWEYRDVLSQKPQPFSPELLLKIGQPLGLDEAKMQACISSDRLDAGVKADIRQAEQANLSATPSFVLGKSTEKGVEGEAIVGAFPFENFRDAMEALRKKI